MSSPSLRDLTRLSPLLWVKNNQLQIMHPIHGRLIFTPYDYQSRLLADDSPTRLVLKARQVGITQALAVETTHAALHQPGATILWLSKDRESASLALQYVKYILHGLGVKLERDAETFIRLENGAKILSLPATQTSGRGWAASRVYLDEFAFVKADLMLWQAVQPTVAHGGKVTVVSTPSGQNNLFFLLWSGQQGGEWSRHVIHWRDCPSYSQAWYERQRPKYTAQQWASEFETSFEVSGSARFRPEDIERAHDGATGLQPAQEGKRYVTAWDIGRRRDATVGVTLTDATPYQVVAFERFEGLPYPEIQKRIEARWRKYPGRHVVESTGVGDPVIENLLVNVDGFSTTAKSKAQILDGLSLALERGDLKWAGLGQLDTEMLLYQDEDSDLVQDCVMALAIAVQGTTLAKAAHLPDTEAHPVIASRWRPPVEESASRWR